ncbi:MAG: M56 family metallopeptidase [Bacteroidaceae bacterium]|nr:M56 family metallopeptidase [Bacteroidaceae bacterium]
MSIEIGFYPLAGILIAGLLYGIYRLVLRMRVAPRTSQWFIIGSVVLSLAVTFVVPVKMVEKSETISRPTPVPLPCREGSNYSETISTPVTEDIVTTQETATTQETVTTPLPTREGYGGGSAIGSAWLFVYCIGTLLVLLHMFGQLVWLLWMKRRSAFVGEDRSMSIYETTFATPFSFGRNIFLPASLDSETHRYVLMHEQSHVRHSHFAVLCLMEVMVAAQWFNPFAWLLMNELKMQHEMQVDSDMLRGGVERRAYQMSLLNVASNSGRWVLMQTAFGSSPLKFRILFMNRTLDAKNVRRRLWSGVAVAVALLIGFTFVACQLNPRVPKSPVDGVWTMDWIRNTNGTAVNYPFRRHMKYIGNDWLLVISYNTQDGHNFDCGFSAEEQVFRNDTIYNRKHEPAHYELLNGGDQHIVVWERDSFQNAMVYGPSITEQWTRVERDADIDYVLQHLYSSERQAHGRRILGVWEQPLTDADGKPLDDVHHYIVFTDDLFYSIHYSAHDHDYSYCAGDLFSRTLSFPSDSTLVIHGEPATIAWHDSDHITLRLAFDTTDGETFLLQRSTLPPRLLHALKSTF